MATQVLIQNITPLFKKAKKINNNFVWMCILFTIATPCTMYTLPWQKKCLTWISLSPKLRTNKGPKITHKFTTIHLVLLLRGLTYDSDDQVQMDFQSNLSWQCHHSITLWLVVLKVSKNNSSKHFRLQCCCCCSSHCSQNPASPSLLE